MYIECFLCGKKIPVHETKKGSPWFQCEDCEMRCFVNGEQGVAGLDALALNGARFERKTKAPEVPQAPAPYVTRSYGDGDIATVIAEIKKVNQKVSALEAKVNEAPAPRRERKTPRKRRMTVGEYIEANA